MLGTLAPAASKESNDTNAQSPTAVLEGPALGRRIREIEAERDEQRRRGQPTTFRTSNHFAALIAQSQRGKIR